MRTEDAKALVAQYGTSYFWRPEPSESVDARKVPILQGRDLVAAMIENVRQSRRDIENTAARLKRAREDGLLDRDVFASLDKEKDRELRKAWVGAVNTLRGDYVRAVGGLAHWQGYAEWASEQEAAGTPRNPAPPFKPDPRLPPEQDEDDGVPF